MSASAISTAALLSRCADVVHAGLESDQGQLKKAIMSVRDDLVSNSLFPFLLNANAA